ncbi:MAG: type II and III secretion system protein family protein [Alphaproteobacteria bacterium]|nr:MAG: type II and III secretion system protein family protein [Alphaproteobacteria bacterium]
MSTRNLTRAALGAAVLAASFAAAFAAEPVGVPAQSGSIQVVGSDSSSRFVQLGIGKSVVIDLPRDIKDVLVAEPKFANAVVRSTRRAYLIGVAVGQTNIYFFDAEGRQIAGFDVAVTRDLNGIRAMLQKLLPHADVRVDGVGEGVMLSGSVANAAELAQANDVAVKLVGSADKVVNNLNVRGRDQVMLKVTVAEVQRDVIKQLGVDLNGSLSYGSAVINFNNANPFTALGQPLVEGNGATGTFKTISATLRAMERAGVIRTLAEPNLTAISGESASFLAGGEFPVPAGYTCDPTTRACQLAIQFKKFGVGLNFTPVVLSEGRISLKVLTEVSELSNENSIQLVQGTATQTIPAIKTRRAETTVEIPSGGALALAGMIQEQTKHQISGLPGLMNLPVLGTLFKSRDYVNRQTELMVIVTPYIARAVAQKDLSRPDDGFADSADPAAILLGRLNRIYGAPGKPAPAAGYSGKYGFILD